MPKALTALVLSITASLIAAPAAFACSCMPCDQQPSFTDSEYTDGAFVGELLSVRRGASLSSLTGEAETYAARDLLYLFQVKRSIKGDMPKYVLVRSAADSAACGVDFSFNGLNAVAVSRDDQGRYSSGLCSQMCWGTEENSALLTEQTVQTLHNGYGE